MLIGFWAIQICATATAIGLMVGLLDLWGGLPLDWWQWAVVAGIFGALSNLSGMVTNAGRDVALIQKVAHSPLLMMWRFAYASAFTAATGALIVGCVVGTILWAVF